MMEDKKTTKRIPLDYRFILCTVIVAALVYMLTSTLLHVNDVRRDVHTISYDSMWFYEDGTPADLNNLKEGDEVIIHKKADAKEINDRTLCFFSKSIHFSIFMDEVRIYDYHPDPPKILGKAYGIFPHSVNLPVLYSDGVIRIVINNIYSDEPGYLREMVLDDGGQFLIGEMQDSAMDFLLCLIVFTFGAVLFVVGLIGRYFEEERYEIISVGTFAMVAALWVASETAIVPLLTGAPIAVHFLDYICLDLLSLPGVIFVSSVTRNKYKKYIIWAFSFMTAAKIIYSIISTLTGGKDYHKLLFLTHILLAITVVTVIVLVVRGLMNKMLRSGLIVGMLLVLLFSMAMGVVDIVRYVTRTNEYYHASYYKYALFLFILVCGIYEFVRISDMSRRGRYAEIMEEMAYQDGLTGLQNRMAFNREIGKASKQDTDLALIMLDLNYLKNVNDELGHDAGDQYIIKMAELMRKVFCHGEKLFRIGGDEFFVLGQYKDTDPVLEESLKSLDELVAEDHSISGKDMPLSIAYGYTGYKAGEMDIEDQIRIADKNMYEKKAEMKRLNEQFA